MEKPKGSDSSEVVKNNNPESNMTAAAKLDLVLNMLRKTETCPTCGHEEETGFLSPEEAKRLLSL